MKKHIVPLLGVALVAALVATGIFYGFLVTRLHEGAESGSSRRVFVAVRALDRGSVLKPEDVKESTLPAEKQPGAAFLNVDQVVGLTLLQPLGPNEPFTSARLSQRGAAGGASLAIPSGMRAVSVHPSDSTGVVALLRSGSRVDVQVLETRLGRDGLIVRRFLENVEVLSKTGPDNAGSHRPDVTLLASPRDADRLTLADASLQIRLVLRNPADGVSGASPGVSPASIMEGSPLARN